MKKICMILVVLVIAMGYVPSARANTQEERNAQENVIIYFSDGDSVGCTIDQIDYMISTKDHYAIAVSARHTKPVLEIPSSISLYGVQYPVTKFDNTITVGCGKLPAEYFFGFIREEIKLPDSVLEVVLYDVKSKKINIPKHAQISLELDIDDIVVEIPADHDYYQLKDNFIYDRKDPTKIHYILGASGCVQIPEGVKYIGRLLSSNRIEKLTLPSTLESIGSKFAYKTGALKEVNLSKTKLKEIPDWAFYNIRSLKRIKFPSTLRVISRNAFAGSGLKEVVITNKVTGIGDSAFSSCRYLKKVTIGNKVTDIGDSAFSSCKHLKKVTIGKKVKRICADAFAWSAISEITIPENVEKMDDTVFIGAKNLRKITFLHKKKMLSFKNSTRDGIFQYTRSGIKFYVRNQKMAKQLKRRLKNSKVQKAKIYAGKKKKLIYKNVRG